MKIDRPYLPLVYRDSSAGWVTGVCGGLSEITGVRPVLLRLSALIATYLFPLVVVPAYLAAFFLLRDRARSNRNLGKLHRSRWMPRSYLRTTTARCRTGLPILRRR